MRDLLVERWGERGRARRRGRPWPVGAIVFERPDELRLARGDAAPAGRRADRRLARGADPAVPRRRGRGPAAVRDRDGGRLRRDDRGHRADERCGASAPAPAGRASSRRARGRQLPQDEKAAPRHPRDQQRRRDRRPRASDPAAGRRAVPGGGVSAARARRGRPRGRRRTRKDARTRRVRLLVIAVVLGAATALIVSRLDLGKAIREVTLPLRHEDIIRQQAERDGPRPGADRRRDLRGVGVPRPDLARRGPRADADHAGDRRHDRDAERGRDLRLRRPRRPRPQHPLRHLLPAPPARPLRRQRGRGARRLQRGPRATSTRWGGAELEADDIPFPETRAYVEEVLDQREQYRDTYADELGL